MDFAGVAGVAEVVKGAGLKIRSRMGSWVRIPPPAPNSHYWVAFLSKKQDFFAIIFDYFCVKMGIKHCVLSSH